jgi:hypothetical protein
VEVNLEQLAKETNAIQSEKYGLLGCDVVEFGDSPTFRNNLSPPYSMPKNKTSKKPAEVGGKLS